MARLTLVAGCVAVLLGSIHFGSGAQNGVAQKLAASKADGAKLDRAATLRTLIESASSAYRAAASDELVGQASAEEIYGWSLRWRASELKGADDKKAGLQANTDHLERMRKLHARVAAAYTAGVKGGEYSKFQASKFYVAEAELMLIDAESDKLQ
jgi:hypothetical protein